VKLALRELTPELWPAYEELFGEKGACAGCWCMYWRLPRGEELAKVGGAPMKRRMKKLIAEGKAEGVLAFDGSRPVGWISFGPRRDYDRIDRAPSLKCDDADEVWSLPCFFVHKDYRGKGVATALLAAGVKALKKRGAKIAEGYPVKASKPGEKMANAFIYTGTMPLFEKQGFEVVREKAKGKQLMRKLLK
jgi:GNAT superfamily N-acetyltransferase